MSEEQITREILEKVRWIDISLRRKVNTLFSGQYRSTFKGQGMVFSDFREYVAGDDIRAISWNLTAKMGRPYVKTFEAEREAPIVFVADISRSLDFGTGDSSKKDVLRLLVGLLAFCAQKSRDPAGLLLFSENVEHYIPPKRDPRQAFYILRELCSRRSQFGKTNLQPAVEYLQRTLKRRSRIFLFSDFLFASPFESDLKQLNARHELVCVAISDPMEKSFPSLGLIDTEDLETGQIITIDTSSRLFKKHFREMKEKKAKLRQKSFVSSGVECIFIDTSKDIYRPVIDFFRRKQSARLKFYG